ncbi:MAG: peptidyl-prolyl cis-trans isomerase [Pirellulales bacterium]|nr:peptidyl-prolyl cis-trans isomerase [Pirellulales bacterium]
MASIDTLPASPPSRRGLVGFIVACLAVLAICLLVRGQGGGHEANAQSPKTPPASTAPRRAVTPVATAPAKRAAAAPATSAAPSNAPNQAAPQPEQNLVAVVNGEEISRNDLGRECLWHFGEQVLESVVNKQLIEQECQRQKVSVTPVEVKQEIERVAKSFNLPVDQWLNLLKSERHITAHQYADDILWPKLALEKLAAPQLAVSPAEIQAAYESEFGPSVQARLIVCPDAAKAKNVQALAVANPDDFGNLAKEHSVDASASSKGLIQPIRRNAGPKEIEQVAFNLKPGQVSDVLSYEQQFLILKCEQIIPARKVPLDQVQPALVSALKDRKLSEAADTLLRRLQSQAQVENIFNDEQQRAAHPGIAAIINGRQVTIRELSEECITRHGIETLDGMISRKLLEQECKKQNVTVSQAEIQEEIARAAKAMGCRDDAGNPDVPTWLAKIKEEQGLSTEIYVHDTVWPTVALKKLVGGQVQVTSEDLQKGFEANYGARVRCRAIVLNNNRRAQQVWEMARANPTPDYFGDLAEQYSIEAGSRALRGEVPPIQRWCGQPVLEKEAFSLKPGELSGIIQVGDKYVILLCEGFTQPTVVKMDEVRELLQEDIQEKKTRLAMAEMFDQLQQEAQVDNMLAGTSQSPYDALQNPLGPAPAEPRTARAARAGTAMTPAANTRPATPPGGAPAAAPRAMPQRVAPRAATTPRDS